MARYGRLLTDAQWEQIRPLLPKRPKRPQGGRPLADDRKVLEGILWILRSGARWQDLPEEFPSPATCWRRLRDWEERGVWLTIWRAFLAELNERQQLNWSESFLDGSFAPAKKGAAESEKPSGARGPSGWWWSTAASGGRISGDSLRNFRSAHRAVAPPMAPWRLLPGCRTRNFLPGHS